MDVVIFKKRKNVECFNEKSEVMNLPGNVSTVSLNERKSDRNIDKC